ncbi:hypothetical protein Gogos_000447 [Gossypium gossypioides]|uniref:RNase H type-1 domain-containing protein n=1 Tax=Gossypium gossypioides TaxID=34282 RepID=A0A7J9CSQ4_GOSGO|nr:hypothetical protein [Gossypium gossypioides]
MRKVMAEDRCSRCGQEGEDSFHVFYLCPTAKEIWSHLNFSWILNNSHLDTWSWLTWVFSQGTNEQCRSFCCGFWLIWTNRNKLLYESRSSTSWDISKQIKSYILELEGSRERELNVGTSVRSRQSLQMVKNAIFFYAAFDLKNSKSASGLVVSNEEGRIVAAKSTLHENIASPFTAEAVAGLQATRLGIQLGFNTLDIIGDSRTVITKCQNTSRDKSEIGAIISDIQSLKDQYRRINFYFIPRSENTEAHSLAKETLKKGEEQYLERETLRSFRGEIEPNHRVSLE